MLAASLLVCLSGLVGFSLSPSVVVALVIRFFSGFFDCLQTVAKAVVADLTVDSDPRDRAVTFGFLGATLSMTRAFSTAAVGFLTLVPADVTSVPAITETFTKYRYFFPLLVCAVPVVLTFFAVVCIMEETLKKKPTEFVEEADAVKTTGPTLRMKLRLLYADKRFVKLLVRHLSIDEASL
jgi:MFS family permease